MVVLLFLCLMILSITMKFHLMISGVLYELPITCEGYLSGI